MDEPTRQQMSMSKHFSPCIQRLKVMQALSKAKDAGMKDGSDKKLYALLYLEGHQSFLKSKDRVYLAWSDSLTSPYDNKRNIFSAIKIENEENNGR